MAVITTLKYGGTSGVPYGQSASSLVKLDFATLIADFITAGGVTTDSATLITIPANTFVEVLQAEVIEANIVLGSGARVDVGDESSDTLFVNNASTLTSGTDLTIATGSKLYTAANTLRVKFTGAGITAGGGIRFVLRLTDLSRVEPAKPREYTN